MNTENKHAGSDFDDFLREEGILEEVTARALQRVQAFQSEAAKKKAVAESGNGSDKSQEEAADSFGLKRSTER